MSKPLLRYLVVATTGMLAQSYKANDTRKNYTNESSTWDIVKQVIDVTSLPISDTTNALVIKKLKPQKAKNPPNSGIWALCECNRKMRLRMKADGFMFTGVKFYGIPISRDMDLSVMECFDEFAMQMSIPDQKKVLAVSIMDFSTEVPMHWYTTLSSNRNHPVPHKSQHCNAEPGQVIKVQYSSSYSTMSDGWEHRDPVPLYYAVISKNKTSSTLKCMQVHGFNEVTGAYDSMEPVTIKRKVVSNTVYWDLFYNEYYWQDHYRIEKVFDFPE